MPIVQPDDGTGRRRVDLGRLPGWLRYTIALIVMAVVVVLAVTFGSDTEVPGWVSNGLIPALGVIVLFLVADGIIRAVRRRR